MNKLDFAPEKGKIYALYRDRVVFDDYTKSQFLNSLIDEDNLLELHLFDDKKEYRYIHTSSRNIEVVIDDSVEHDDFYLETVYVQELCDDSAENSRYKVQIVNYIQYDKDDLLNISNYRLKEVN